MSRKTLTMMFFGLSTGFLVAGCPEEAEDAAGCSSDADCKGDRICVQGMCVFDSGGGSGASSSPGSGGGGDTADEGGGEGDSTEDGGFDSDTGGCVDGELYCSGPDALDYCDGGTLQTYDCTEICGASGWASDGCSDDVCYCGGPLDQACASGVNAFCTCGEWAGSAPCTNDEMTKMYEACYAGQLPQVECFADYVSGNTVDCAAASSYCL